MVRVYRYIFLISLLLPATALAGDYSDCTVLSRSSTELTFTYRPGPLSWTSDELGERPVIANTALSNAPGYPRLPGRIVYIALPPACRWADAELVGTGAVQQVSHTTGRSSLSAAVSTPYPDARVLVDGIFTLHGVTVARLILHALMLETPDAYSYADEMTVRVGFEAPAAIVPAAAMGNRDPFTQILNEVLLNPEDAQATEAVARRSAAKTAAGTNPFVGGNDWIAIRTRGDGIIAVTGTALRLAGVSTSGRDPRQFRLFAGPGRQLSTKVSAPPPPFEEAAITVTGTDDGVFNDADTILFWADGLNRWDVDSLGRLVDLVHRYDHDNVYWLAMAHEDANDPRRINGESMPPIAGAPDQFTGVSRARHEQESVFRVAASGFIDSYYTWYWRNQRVGPLSFVEVDDPESGRPATLEVGSWAGFAGRDPARLIIGGQTILPTSVSLSTGEDRTTISTFRLAAFNASSPTTLYFDSTGGASFYLDYFTVEYERRLDASNGPVKFAAPDTSSSLNLVVSADAALDLWDITDSHSPMQVVDAVIEGSSVRFGVTVAKRSRRIFYAAPRLARRPAQSISPVTVVDLHSPASGADYFAIGPRSFQNATEEFLEYRAGTDALSTRYIAIEDVYNSFSLGIEDPLAIRRFLAHAHLDWPGDPPTYALLVGDGTNDYLNHRGSGSVNYVPPYIVRDDPVVSDESYVYFSDRAVLDSEGDSQENPFPDMLIGRWPVKTTSEIAAIITKVERYESGENLGPWRSRVMMVADDEFGDRGNLSVCEYFHIRDAEAIAEAIPPHFDVSKIYLTEYPFDNPGCYTPSATGCAKPTAKEAIVAGLNEGALVFDYLGHGNADVLAHERVFERTVDLPRLTNVQTPTAVLTFSCSIGFFDDPINEGMSEEWFRMPEGGAVAVVSVTRIAGALANAELNEVVFDLLLGRGVTGIAAAVYTGKLLRQYFEPRCRLFSGCQELLCPCDNDRGYILFGDPAMRLGVPSLRTNFTYVSPDSLTALALTEVSGDITDSTGALQTGFDGTLSVSVVDVPRDRLYPLCENQDIQYQLPGGTLFRGPVAVTDGRFSFAFITPKDIAYGQVGASIMGHAVGEGLMASGAVDSLPLASSGAPIMDTAGPMITLQDESGQGISDGFRIPSDQTLTVSVNDTSGINLTGASGHQLLVFADQSEQPLADLTETFAYLPGSYRRGEASFALADLDLGMHRFRIKAWDNVNNSAQFERAIEVVAPGTDIGFALTEFLNFPNPFEDVTTFYFRATRAIREARIRLFTLAGRLIWESTAQDGVTTWDGRDADGDQVANGVYLAQIEAEADALAEGNPSIDKRAYREMKVVVSR